MEPKRLFVRPTGLVEHLYDDALTVAGKVEELTRVSHVEPGWYAGDFVGWFVEYDKQDRGKTTIGPFVSRAAALNEEKRIMEGRLRRGEDLLQ